MIDIIIPVYNEEENIVKTLESLYINVKEKFRIFIIYDMDEDTTLLSVEKIKNKYEFNISCVKNKYGEGVLGALKTGFEICIGETVLVMMADLADSPDIIDKMYQKIQAGYDIVCGSRYMKGGKQNGGPFLKKFLSRTAGLLLYRFGKIPTHDSTNSFKMYNRQVLNELNLESKAGFELSLEILVKSYKKGFKITEIPYSWYDRTDGKSRFQMYRWLPEYIRWFLYAFK